jgi:hypothetical protein
MAKNTLTKKQTQTLYERAREDWLDLTKGKPAVKQIVSDLFYRFSGRFAALEQRLTELERCPLDWKGVWSPDTHYTARSLVTHNGSVFYAQSKVAKGVMPGEGEGWKLIVKRGRDGKDAR